MADIDFYQDDSEDAQDDGGDNGLGCEDYDGSNPDDNLTPIQRLEKYIDSENIFNRQMVARSLLDTLRLVDINREDANTVLKAMARLSEDPEPTVRAELMEQVPHLAVYCHENKALFDDPISSYVLPTVVKYLTDTHNQVRKTSQAALLVLLEQDLVDKRDVEQQVCPVILDLSSPDSIDDFRTEAVALMSKMAPLVGRDITERLFLPRFCELCTDALFHVRKVCAANFGDLCSVVAQDKTEEHLLPKFYYLCEDGVWGVRKACAECFMAVSCSCSLNVRRNELASLFISLICDQSRWVRMAAFQALGGFISTFADPAITGLYFNEDGTLIVGNAEEIRAKLGLTRESECLVELAGSISGGVPVPSKSVEDESVENLEAEVDQSACISGTSEEPDTADNREMFEMELDEDVNEIKDGKGLDVHAVSSSTDEHSSFDKSYEELRAEKYEGHSAISQESNTVIANAVGGESKNEGHPVEYPEATSDEVPAFHGSEHDVCNNNNKNSSNEVTLVPAEQETKIENKNSVEPSNIPLPCANDEESSSNSAIHIRSDGVEQFNSFQFWRPPLPDVDVDEDLDKNKPATINVISEIENEDLSATEIDVLIREEEESIDKLLEKLDQAHFPELDESEGQKEDDRVEDDDATVQIFTANVSSVSDIETPAEETVANIGSTHVIGQQLNEATMAIVNGVVKDVSGSTSSLSYSPEDTPCSSHEHLNFADLTQDVIPQPLLDHYLSMTDPSRAQTVDTEIAKHCAYSLPAVAYTLGREHWPCLKDLYETLAADMQWKVRRTLAFSLHELAVIVGEEITNKDLVPVFNGFLKDLDEVRIGVLKHLADFLKLLKPDIRRDYLYKMQDFLNTDNNRNWRFREELAEQLTLLNELYAAEDIAKHLVPVALALAEDKVAEVRTTAFRVLAGMLRRLSMANDKGLVDTFVGDILERFVLSKKWNKRQIYAQLCQHMLEEVALPAEQFAKELLPSLLSLGSDPIPNVRISLAKALAQYILTSEYFTSASNPHHEDLLKTVQGLQSDADRDVRYFISRQPQSETDPGDMIPV